MQGRALCLVELTELGREPVPLSLSAKSLSLALHVLRQLTGNLRHPLCHPELPNEASLPCSPTSRAPGVERSRTFCAEHAELQDHPWHQQMANSL